MPEFLQKIKDQIPTFVGIKFTSNDLAEAYQAMRVENKKYSVFLGSDQVKITLYYHSSLRNNKCLISYNKKLNFVLQLLAPATLMGIDGFIATSSNLFPTLTSGIVQAGKDKNFVKAKELQERLTALVTAITPYGN